MSARNRGPRPPTLVAALQSIRPDAGALSLRESWLVTEGGGDPAGRLSPGEGLAVGDTLGEGGSSVVRLGTQRSLGRQVAVKSLRGDRGGPGHEQLLLREAWVTGALEHPNIVPIYDIASDGEGRPLIVLKRVSGRSWGELLWSPEALEAAAGGADPLEWNLRVLLQVCDAVRFAHARGFLHRDLKPDNVMIGDFGEVYVVDWGLALRLDPEGDPRIPLAGSEHRLAGTPAYMAPEMLGEGRALTALTDVYLLGAILYELITGTPPWCGGLDDALFDRIRAASVVLPPEAPPRLGAICLRAMGREPGERYPSVAAFREAVQGYLRRRGADALALEAQSRLAELEGAVGEGERQDLYALHGQCRFGYQQALAAWPEHPEARAGLARADALMVGYELDRGDLESARALLGGLEDPALEARAAALAAALEAREARVEALEARARELDPGVDWRGRLRFIAGLGGLWAAVGGGAGWLELRQGVAFGYDTVVGFDAFFTVLVGGLALAYREAVLSTAFNRQMVGCLMAALLLQHPANLASWLQGWEARTAFALHPLIWATVCGVLALLYDRRFAPATLGFVGAFLAAAWRPALLYPAISVSCVLFAVNLLVLWRRPAHA